MQICPEWWCLYNCLWNVWVFIWREQNEAKILYHNNKFNQNRSNMRKIWSTLSEIIHKQKENRISINKICFQGKYIDDQTEIGNTFHDFFIKIGPNLTKHIIQTDGSHISYMKYINLTILSSFNFQLIDDESLKKTFKFASQQIVVWLRWYLKAAFKISGTSTNQSAALNHQSVCHYTDIPR